MNNVKLFNVSRRYTVMAVPTGRVMAFDASSRYDALNQGRAHFAMPVRIMRVS
tara:strand:+ start:795 stop:953 length:159 start_codon:yes stop_codon:yes gene_type:complete